MSTYGSGDVAWVYLDGYQVAGDVISLEDEQVAQTENNTGLGVKVTSNAFNGVVDVTILLVGFFNDVAAGIVVALDPTAGGALGAQHTALYAIAGDVIGSSCILARGALQSQVKKLLSSPGLTKLNAKFNVQQALLSGRVILNRVARTTAANSDATSVNNLASSANGGTALLVVDTLVLGGYTNLAVTMRDSADNVSFLPIAGGSAFTVVTLANTAVSLAISGIIRQYTSAAWAWGGAGSSQSWTGVVALVRNP